uniref:NK-lysin tandem duplicate 4 n=1 Tax=Nothobranchius furzeri TaxID=105023 RepID=A0A8C6LF65_NOTFU
METSSVLLLCILVTCSVWTVQGRSFEVSINEEEQVDASGEIPGICWGCKWALKKVKNAIGQNATSESIIKKLKTVCDQMGLLKSKCHKFVTSHLGELVEEMTTTDDVRTICVNTGNFYLKEFYVFFFINLFLFYYLFRAKDQDQPFSSDTLWP